MEESLIVQRSAYSALHKTDLKALEVGKSLMQYVKNASSRRIESLKIKKVKEDDKVNEKQQLAR